MQERFQFLFNSDFSKNSSMFSAFILSTRKHYIPNKSSINESWFLIVENLLINILENTQGWK